MFWMIISLLVILGIGVPILQTVYNNFLNTTNGSWLNWVTSNATVSMNATTACVTYTSTYTEIEFNTFRFVPLLAGLMALAFLLMIVGGGIARRNEERRMRGEK